jgi:hypothetical protein
VPEKVIYFKGVKWKSMLLDLNMVSTNAAQSGAIVWAIRSETCCGNNFGGVKI